MFPYILVRSGGLPFRWAVCWSEDELNEGDLERVNDLMALHEFAVALLFSAPHLLLRYADLSAKSFGELNKRDRQTIRKLVQYAARAAAKVSPFSSFCRIHAATVCDHPVEARELTYKHRRRVNLDTLNSLKKYHTQIIEEKLITHRDYLFDDSGALYWYQNEAGVCTINRLPDARQFGAVLSEESYASPAILARVLSENLSISETVAQDYVGQLTDAGLFKMVQVEEDAAIRNVLRSVEQCFEGDDSVLQCAQELDAASALLSRPPDFIVDPNKLFYDDYLSDDIECVNPDAVALPWDTLESIARLACTFDLHNRQPAWRQIAEIVGDTRRPLLEVLYDYEDAQAANEWPALFADMPLHFSDGVVHIQTEAMGSKMPPPNSYGVYSALLLSGHDMCYLNHLTHGYGRMWSRHLHDLNQHLHNELVNWCRANDPARELIQIVDGYPHNAVSRVALFNQSLHCTGECPGLNLIEVYFKEGRPTLYHRGLGKDVYPVDIDVLVPDVRGLMYKFLMLFSKMEPRLSLLRQELRRSLTSYARNGVLPRVVVDNRLVISRKRFTGVMPGDVVTRTQLLRFLETLGLGTHIYVTAGGYKPQFYAIKQFIHLDRLWRDLRQAPPGDIVIEEAYPSYHTDAHVTERVVQWAARCD